MSAPYSVIFGELFVSVESGTGDSCTPPRVTMKALGSPSSYALKSRVCVVVGIRPLCERVVYGGCKGYDSTAYN